MLNRTERWQVFKFAFNGIGLGDVREIKVQTDGDRYN